MSRYFDRADMLVYERDKILGGFVKRRNLPKIRSYATPQFFDIGPEDLKKFDTVKHVWSARDTYWKLAHKHYGDSSMWYMIALFNKKPSEANLKVGDVIYIPHPIEDVLEFYS